MKIDGACHCGSLAFEAEVDPSTVSICHCSDCQRLTGTAFRVSVAVEAGKFRMLKGVAREYIKKADSGAQRVQGFCGECGTPIYATDAEHRQTYGVRVGAVRQRDRLVPTKQIWRRSAPAWLPSMTELETWPEEDG